MKRWVLFTTYGWLIGILFVVGFAIIIEAVFKLKEESGIQAAVGIGMGAGVGLMQWLAIRNYTMVSQRFFWFSLIGFSVAFIFRDLVDFVIDVPTTVEITIPFAVLLGAFITGWLQIKFAFGESIGDASKWIYYSMTGWLLATIVTMSISMFNLRFSEYFPQALVVILALVFLSIGGPILGFISGRIVVPAINNRLSLSDQIITNTKPTLNQ